MFLKKAPRRIAATLAFIGILLFTAGSAFAAALPSYHYVALGDSLAAGQTPYLVEAGYGYTDILADKLEEAGVLGSYDNFGKSGYKTGDVLDGLATEAQYAAIAGADLITLDAGANDILDDLRNNPSAVPEDIQTAIGNIGRILTVIQTVNADAKIYVMGYYNAMPNLPEEQEAWFLYMLDQFNGAIEWVCEETGATYVDTKEAMDQHLDLYLPGDIHPTVQGYRAIAKEFWNQIKLDFTFD